MKRTDGDAIKIVSASIFQSKEPVIQDRDWGYICAHAEIDERAVYCLEYLPDGFLLNTRQFTLRYRHAALFYERKIDFQKFQLSNKKIPEVLPVKLPIQYVELAVHKVDAGGEAFALFQSVHELADFLKVNPIIAEALAYVPKKKA